MKNELLNKSKAISGQSNAWHLPDLAEEAMFGIQIKNKDQNDISQKIEVLRYNITYECKIDDQIKKQSAGPVKLIIDRYLPQHLMLSQRMKRLRDVLMNCFLLLFRKEREWQHSKETGTGSMRY